MNPTASNLALPLEVATTPPARRLVFWGPAATAAPGDGDRLGMPEYVWAALYGSDDVAQAIGSQLEDLLDVQHFESMLQRPVQGLYANLYGGEVHRLLAPEVANLGARLPPQGSREALRLDPALYAPNWPDRHLLHSGIPEELVAAQTDQRLLTLVDTLLPKLPRDLRLVLQLRQQKDRRMGLFLHDMGEAFDGARAALASLMAQGASPGPAELRAIRDALFATPIHFPLRLARHPGLQRALRHFDELVAATVGPPRPQARAFNLPLYQLLEEVGVQVNTAKFNLDTTTPRLRRPFWPPPETRR